MLGRSQHLHGAALQEQNSSLKNKTKLKARALKAKRHRQAETGTRLPLLPHQEFSYPQMLGKAHPSSQAWVKKETFVLSKHKPCGGRMWHIPILVQSGSLYWQQERSAPNISKVEGLSSLSWLDNRALGRGPCRFRCLFKTLLGSPKTS